MNIYKYFGKLLLYVTIPVVFFAVASIALSLLFAMIGVFASTHSFGHCFSECMSSGAVMFFVGIITLIATVMYIGVEND